MPGFVGGAMQGASIGSSFGPIGAGVGAIAGGLLGSAEGDNGARDRQQAAEAFAEKQFQFQQDLAKNGVRWRVDDARAAMIHPALALGMQPFNASPVSLMYPESDNSNSWVAQAGHSIQRAVHATRTQEERDQAGVMSALAVERLGLQNDLLRSQIARLQQDQVGPPMVDPANPGVREFGTSDARILEKPLERMAGAPGAAHQEAGAVTDLGFSKTKTGYAIVPSKDWKDRGEDQIIPELAWGMRNHILPTLRPDRHGMPPPETWLPKGATHWVFHRFKQEWQPGYGSPPGPEAPIRGRFGFGKSGAFWDWR